MSLLPRLFGSIFGYGGALRGTQALVVGLGNPGDEYRSSRHNVGFRVVGSLLGGLTGTRSFTASKAQVVVGRLGAGKAVALARPQTFMNRSGPAVAGLLKSSRLALSECIVVVDDVNLALGRVRVRRRGSDGGHNGLRSIIDAVGDGFARVRIGVGPVPDGVPLIDYVLGAFDEQEEEKLASAVDRAVDAVRCFITDGIGTAMNRYN